MTTAEHGLKIVTGQPHATHDVDFKKSLPRLVGFVEKADCLVDAEVIDQNIDVGPPQDGLVAPCACSIVRHENQKLSIGKTGTHVCHGFVYADLHATVDDDCGALGGQERAISKPMPPEEAVSPGS